MDEIGYFDQYEEMKKHETIEDCLYADTVWWGSEDWGFLGHWSLEWVELYGECTVCGREIVRSFTYGGVDEGGSNLNVPVPTNSDGPDFVP